MLLLLEKLNFSPFPNLLSHIDSLLQNNCTVDASHTNITLFK